MENTNPITAENVEKMEPVLHIVEEEIVDSIDYMEDEDKTAAVLGNWNKKMVSRSAKIEKIKCVKSIN